jgi:hypothetical protein
MLSAVRGTTEIRCRFDFAEDAMVPPGGEKTGAGRGGLELPPPSRSYFCFAMIMLAILL